MTVYEYSPEGVTKAATSCASDVKGTCQDPLMRSNFLANLVNTVLHVRQGVGVSLSNGIHLTIIWTLWKCMIGLHNQQTGRSPTGTARLSSVTVKHVSDLGIQRLPFLRGHTVKPLPDGFSIPHLNVTLTEVCVVGSIRKLRWETLQDLRPLSPLGAPQTTQNALQLTQGLRVPQWTSEHTVVWCGQLLLNPAATRKGGESATPTPAAKATGFNSVPIGWSNQIVLIRNSMNH